MTTNTTNTDPLAQMAQIQALKAEMEAKLKELSKMEYKLKKGEKPVEIERMRVTEKGQLCVYFNFQRWPITLGKEALTLLTKPEVIEQLKAHAEALPTYSERVQQGLTGKGE